ncbi:MAG TPA: DEAD/DEAH box helicase [Microlunatus sp.]
MQVVHACWSDHVPGARPRVALWSEDSTLATTSGRRGRPPRVAPHPYAGDSTELTIALDVVPDAAAPDSVVLDLPTRGGSPLASPELVREDPPRATGPVRPGRWRVPALFLEAHRTYAVLSGLDLTARAYGASVHHLVELVAFADDLVTRGRILPMVLADGPAAVWRPVLTGPDAAWARVLAAALPPALVAADRRDDGDGEGVDDPFDLWAAAFDDLVDASVRAALGSVRLTLGRRGTATSRAWLAALTGSVRTFRATEADLDRLTTALARWQSDVLTGPVRAFFRLTEPTTAEGPDTDERDLWRLRFGLQATDEQSLVAEADQVWRTTGALPGLGRALRAPQETFLAELGKAARLYPALDEALRTARPDALELDDAGAHAFLREAAPTLATAGFGVQLPGWWTRPATRLGVRLTATPRTQPGVVGTSGGVGLSAIAEFRYDVAIGDDTLTADELTALAELKSPLVRLRGQWVELDPRRLEAALRLAGRRGELTVAELLRRGLGVDAVEDDVMVTAVAAEGWLGDLLAGRTPEQLAAVVVPATFQGTLRPYQARGVSWLEFLGRLGIGGVLADDMGLGKTVQLLALLALDQQGSNDDRAGGPTLLVCPMSLVGNWQREAERFTPDVRVHVHHGSERARGRAFAAAVAASDLVITTYAIATRDAAVLREIGWRRVIVDEAQAIKNAATRQATAIRSIPAEVRIAVTGTPVENRLADLWSILEFANPGLLGSATSFKKRYAEPIERHGDDEAAARLRRFTGPFVLRRLKTDRSIITDLPEKLEIEVLANLTAEQASLYQAVVDDMLAKIDDADGIERRGLVLATMTRLKQVCNHPAHFLRDGSPLPGRSGKLERLDEILAEVLQSGERALLFTQYAEFGAMLRGHLAGRFGREVLYLHGGVARSAREAMVARFQSDEAWAPPLFVLSLKAGGTGLTLTAANHVVHVDRWWNPAVEDQATDRAFRIGQRRAVQVRKLVSAGTFEEKIAAMITEKRGLAAKIVGTGETWLTELSTADLAELLRLEAGAVVE